MFRRSLCVTLAIACVVSCLAPWNVQARSRGAKKRRSPAISASYIRMRNRWHARAPQAAVRAFLAQSPHPALVLSPVGDAPDQTLLPSTDRGDFDDAARELAALALADKHTGATHPIEPRLLDLVYDAARHFSAPYVHVISGYRANDGNSRHAQGRAVDIVLPGVRDRALAVYLRSQGFVGVGIYPRAGFVHLDVRARSYFWSDNSAPSERSRPRVMLIKTAQRADARARQRGVIPTVDLPNAIDAEAPPVETPIGDPEQPSPDVPVSSAL